MNCWSLAVTVPSGAIVALTPLVVATITGAVVLDRPHPRHRQLLVGHLGQPERGVVAGHGEHRARRRRRCRRPGRRRRPPSRSRRPTRTPAMSTAPAPGPGDEVAGPVGVGWRTAGRTAATAGTRRTAAPGACRCARRRRLPGRPHQRGVGRGRVPSGLLPAAPRRRSDRHADRAGGPVDRAAASGLRSGSMSEEFSGQSTRSGCGPAAGGDVGGELLGDPHVVVEHGAALGVEVQAEAGHVALHGGDRHRRASGAGARRRDQRGERAGEQGGQRPARRATSGRPDLAGARAGAPASPSASPASTATNDSSGAPPTAATGSSGPSGWPNATRPHGKPPNGHPAAQRLGADPHRGGPQRARRAAATPAAIPAPAAPTNSASAPQSASHGTGPT